MKKFISILFSAVLLCGCSGSASSGYPITSASAAFVIPASASPTSSPIGMTNPMTEVNSASEFTDKDLQDMITPANAAETKYFLYKDGPSEIQFTLDEVEYSYRSMIGDLQDISGVYATYPQDANAIFYVEDPDANTLGTGSPCDQGVIAKWQRNGNSYSLFAKDSQDVDAFCAVLKEIIK